MQLLDRRFPGGNLTLSAFGYPGASPTFLRACSDTLLVAVIAPLTLTPTPTLALVLTLTLTLILTSPRTTPTCTSSR